LEVAVLAWIEAASTADATALIWSADPFAASSASAPPQQIVTPSPIAMAACVSRIGQTLGLRSRKALASEKRTESCCIKCRIIFLPAISDGSVPMGRMASTRQ